MKIDLQEHENYANNGAIKWDVNLTQNQFDAVVSFSYNGLSAGKFIEAHKNGNVYDFLMQYTYSNGQHLPRITKKKK